MKMCRDCGLRPVTMMQHFKDRPSIFRAYCNKCLSRRTMESRAKNPDKRLNKFKAAIWTNYRIRIDELVEILNQQEWLCANKGCLRELTFSTIKSRSMTIDHCHITKVVRGVLCTQCNTALGLLGESRDKMSGLIYYMDRWA